MLISRQLQTEDASRETRLFSAGQPGDLTFDGVASIREMDGEKMFEIVFGGVDLAHAAAAKHLPDDITPADLRRGLIHDRLQRGHCRQQCARRR